MEVVAPRFCTNIGKIGFVAPCPIVNKKTEQQTLNVLNSVFLFLIDLMI